MRKQIFIVTGAPGSGKTVALEELLAQDHPRFLALDLDWLMQAASELAGQDVAFYRPSWKPFRQVWFDLLEAILRNGRTPVLFANIDAQDVEELTLPNDIGVRWALLDCDDALRRMRVSPRPRVTEDHIQDNLADARVLRQAHYDIVVDTGRHKPAEAARMIQKWVEKESNS